MTVGELMDRIKEIQKVEQELEALEELQWKGAFIDFRAIGKLQTRITYLRDKWIDNEEK